MPKRVHAEISDGGGDPIVIYADDWPNAYYAFVTNIEEARGSVQALNQVVTLMDAALVSWYRQINVFNVGALNNTAGASGFRLVEIVMRAQDYDAFTQRLFLDTGHALTDNTWWILRPVIYDLRRAVRVDTFAPPNGSNNPADVAASNSIHAYGYVRNNLIAPRTLLRLRYFAYREVL